ncbi:MAG: hypothetical protein RIS76_54 [Verrucomicrobiota bacterium]|jgi:hypothetical protein
MLCRGKADNAFHGLLEIDPDILPELVGTYQVQPDLDECEFVIEVIWQYRGRSIIPFLGEALMDPEERVWKQALDGLVAFATPAALDALRSARTRKLQTERKTEEFREWLEEGTGVGRGRAPRLTRD